MHKWLQSLAAEELAECTATYATFALAKAEWLRTHPTAPGAQRGASSKCVYHLNKLDHRIATGMAYLQWRAGFDRLSQPENHLVEFCKHHWQVSGKVPKTKKVWLSRCIKDAEAVKDEVKPWKMTRFNRAPSRRHVPREFRMRNYGQQGRPHIAPMLREALFDWFISIRASVCARLTPKLALIKAKAIATEMLGEMRRISAQKKRYGGPIV